VEQLVQLPTQVITASDPAMLSLRASYEAGIAMAHGAKRDELAVVQASVSTLDAYPELAEIGTYAIPYRQHTRACKDGPWAARQSCKCPITSWAKGPGIHLAVMMAADYGYCRDEARVYPSEEGRVLVEGVFVDFVRARMCVRQRMVSRARKGKGGGVYQMSEPDFSKEVEINASKMHRNAILKGLPRRITETVYQHAAKICEQQVQDEGTAEAWNKAVVFFADRGVGEDRLVAVLGKGAPAELRAADIVNLRHLVRTIQAQIVSVEQVFGVAASDGRAADAGKPMGAATEERDD
jgi:hypothetical protein